MFASHLAAPLENEDNNQANLGIYTVVIYLGMNQNVFRKLALQGKKQNLELNNSHMASGGFCISKGVATPTLSSEPCDEREKD